MSKPGFGRTTLLSCLTLAALSVGALVGCGDNAPGAAPDAGKLCGNGVVDTAAGELCDDGNSVGGDGCGPRCLLENPVCGNGRVELGETCDDGNTAAADGCSAVCLLEGAGVCGNGMRDGTEDCDDGNMAQTDECLNTCRLPRCGDGNVRAGVEDCDSGQANSNSAANACRLDCQRARCGDGVRDTGSPLNETCDDGNTSSDDGCSATCVREPRCGDAVVDPGEGCDDGNTSGGDGCSASCVREPRCGDGEVQVGESCDDANIVAGDGCSMTCQAESGHVYEVEPNGTVATATVLALGSQGHGAIEPAGDVDLYAVTLTAAGDLRAEIHGATGPTSCTGDPELQLLAPNGTTVLATDDDDGNGLCSLINPLAATTPDVGAQRLAAGTYYLRVLGHSTTGRIADYRLVVTQVSTCANSMREGTETCDDGNQSSGDLCSALCLIEPVCGNSVREAPEQCDDGGTMAGDGCDDLCRLEFTPELEPNDLITSATPLGTIGAAGLTIVGAITPVNELDFYVFQLDGLADVRIETFDDLGVGSCAGALDTIVQLRASDGATVLVEDDNDGPSNCSLIDPTVAADDRARGLRPGSYYVRVSAPLNRSLPRYRVRITLIERCGDSRRSTSEFCDDGNIATGDGCDALCRIEGQCGNGILHPQEQCDDGNLAASDGCTALCDVELVGAESEPNDSVMTANPVTPSQGVRTGTTLSTDSDWYVFTLTQPTAVLIETFDASGPPTCDVVDTTLNLLASDGTTVIATDTLDGPGSCALLDPALDAPMRALAAGTYYLQVVGGSSTRADDYRLRIRFLACGNGALEFREFCDDGDTMAGDGCDGSCRIEGLCGDGVTQAQESCDDGGTMAGDGCDGSCRVEVTPEVEPNDAFAMATPLALGRFGQGVTLSTDSDYWSFTLAQTSSLIIDTYDSDGPQSCDLVDPEMALLAPDGVTQLASDLDDGPGNCALLTPATDVGVRNLAAGTYFVRVYGGSTTLMDGYRVRVRALYCGNGSVEQGEFCDDGNIMAGDGCDGSCRVEGLCGDGREQAQEQCDDMNMMSGDGCNMCRLETTAEVEVNNAFAMANLVLSNGSPVTGTTLSTDPDFWTFTLATASNVRVESWDAGGPYSCDVTDVSVALLGSNGTTSLASDSDDGLNACSLLTPYEDTGARNLAAGTYFVRVTGASSTRMDGYTLQVFAQLCGNSAVERGEQCDDGNSVDTDACSNACMLLATPEREPNEDGSPQTGGSGRDGNDFSIVNAQGPLTGDSLIRAAFDVAGDEDVFALRNPTSAPLTVYVETYKGAELACTGTGDTVLRIRDASGAMLTESDDDGVGTCSALRVVIPALTTVYAHVTEFGDTDLTPVYFLRVDFP